LTGDRGVLLALRNSAKYIDGGKHVEIPGPQLMKSAKPIFTGYPGFAFVGYPNRDSTPYGARYNIPEAQTVIRGTLRYSCFPSFIQVLVNIGYLDDAEVAYLKAGAAPISWRQVTSKLLSLSETSSDADLLNAIKQKGELNALSQAERDNIILGFKWLGLLSSKTLEQKGTLLDALCADLEQKMAYGPGERDMVMLQHKFTVKTAAGAVQTHLSTLVEFGIPNGTTAMAKTVGVPCGIATQLVISLIY
jgi:saccharopine dehydrogenase (NADP+, L-glutamate forming)